MAQPNARRPAVSERTVLKLAPEMERGRLYFRPDELREWSVDDALEFIGVGRFQLMALVLCGMVFMGDAVEVMVLGFLQAELQVRWSLSATQAAAISGSVFAGELVGALVAGAAADRYGRRRVFLASAVTVACAGVASSFAGDLSQLLVLRFAVGAGVGGFHVPYDLMAELTPAAHRSDHLLLMVTFYGAGSIMAVGLAWWLLPREGWRSLLLACSVPAMLATLAFPWLPESPRFLTVRGRTDEATAVIERVARANGVRLPPFRLAPEPPEKAGCGALVSRPLRLTSLALWTAWFCFGASLYGLLVLVPTLVSSEGADGTASTAPPAELAASVSAPAAGRDAAVAGVSAVAALAPAAASSLLEAAQASAHAMAWAPRVSNWRKPLPLPSHDIRDRPHHNAARLVQPSPAPASGSGAQGRDSRDSGSARAAAAAAPPARNFTGRKPPVPADRNFLTMMVISMVNLPGPLLLLWILRFVPARIRVMRWTFGLGTVALMALAFVAQATAAVIPRAVCIAVASLMVNMASNTTWLYTTEVYPTTLRATGHAIGNAFARFGALLGPFADTVGVHSFGHARTAMRGEHSTAIALLSVSTLVGCLASSLLVHETHDKTLRDTVGSFDS
eukprot:g977.t1